jgi:hypothetical protein
MRDRHLLLVCLSAGLICGPAAAQYQVVIDFEAPAYAPGELAGQDDWAAPTVDGGAANVVDTDNGPALDGTQCVVLDNLSGSEGHARIRVERAIADVIALGGPVVTLQYDVRVVNDSRWQGEFRVPGMTCAHWWTFAGQWYGYMNPGGEFGGWEYGPTCPDWLNTWHTFAWTVLYGDHGDGQAGQLLSVALDGFEAPPRFASNHTFLAPNASQVVDLISLYLNDGYTNDLNDVIRVDNIIVTGSPLPSAVPVADAGGPYVQDPGSWEGVVFDASGTTDDGEIVVYRWTIGWDGGLLYQGSNPTPRIDLAAGSYTLVLEVVDDTGLHDTAITTAEIGERPPILDQVAGPWGTLNGDLQATNASTEVPFDLGTGEIEVVDETYVEGPWDGLPPEHNVSVVFDRFGNLYWLSWDEFLESYSPNLSRRWRGHDAGEEVHLGTGIENHSVVAGLRYIYVVGGAREISGGVPSAFAFEKSTGQLAWQTELIGEDWYDQGARPKVALYDDKLYVVGENVVETVLIHQIDATTGNHDWASPCYVEMQWGELNNFGGVAFVPNAYGEGLHGLFFNQMSDPSAGGDDGYADMVAIQINPDADTGGATVVWGPVENIDGPGLERSNPIYSATTDRIYTPSFENDDWDYALYVWQPSATPSPLAATYATGEYVGQGYRRCFALDFDGRTIHATGEADTLRSYTDNGDGTFDYVYREFGGFDVNASGFEEEGALLRDASSGDSILLTATASSPDPNEALRVPSKVVAINVSAPVDPNDPVCEFVAEWVCQTEWNPDAETYEFRAPMVGPVPGPDGTFYVIQDHRTHWDRSRLVRLRFRPAEPACLGDVDGDGDTDLSDLAALLSAYGSQEGDPSYNANADFDDDGDVDLTDLAFLLSDYGCRG